MGDFHPMKSTEWSKPPKNLLKLTEKPKNELMPKTNLKVLLIQSKIKLPTKRNLAVNCPKKIKKLSMLLVMKLSLGWRVMLKPRLKLSRIRKKNLITLLNLLWRLLLRPVVKEVKKSMMNFKFVKFLSEKFIAVCFCYCRSFSQKKNKTDKKINQKSLNCKSERLLNS